MIDNINYLSRNKITFFFFFFFYKKKETRFELLFAGGKFATGEVALVFIKHAGGDAASPSLSAR